RSGGPPRARPAAAGTARQHGRRGSGGARNSSALTSQLRMITAKAWCRVDLAGGTLDIWPLGLFHPQARTVNVAVDLAVTVRLRPASRSYRVLQGEGVAEAASAAGLTQDPEAALIGVIGAAMELPPFEAILASESPRGGGLGGSSA